MNSKIKNKIINQIIEKKTIGDDILRNLKQKRSDFKKQVSIQERKESYKFEDSSDAIVKANESSPRPDLLINSKLTQLTSNNMEQKENTNKPKSPTSSSQINFNLNNINSSNINKEERFLNNKSPVNLKKESSLDTLAIESAVRPKKGDHTPKLQFSEHKKDNDRNNEIKERINKIINDEIYTEITLLNENCDSNLITARKEESLISHNMNNISNSSHSQSDGVVKKLQERLVYKGKDFVYNVVKNNKNSNQISKNNISNKDTSEIKKKEYETNTTNNDEFKDDFINSGNNDVNDVNNGNEINDEKSQNFISNKHNKTDNLKEKRNNEINSPSNKVITGNTYMSAETKRDFEKYDMQKINYELNKQYNHTKISKQENFMQRMMFDVFKRQTKDERLTNLLEKNKVKINEVERVNTFNRLIEDANRRLEASEKLDTMKNDYLYGENKSQPRQVSFLKWENIYNERFLNYKKEKEDDLKKRIIEKEKILKEEEDKILENINKTTRRAPKNAVEKICNRMYEEANKRQIVCVQRLKEFEYMTEKQNQLIQSFQKTRVKKEIDYRIKNDLNKPTRAYLAKVTTKKISNSKSVDQKIKCKYLKLFLDKPVQKENLIENYHVYYDENYLDNFSNYEEERKIIPMPSDITRAQRISSYTLLSSNSNPKRNYNNHNNKTANTNSELKLYKYETSPVTAKIKKNINLKNNKFMPEFMAANIVESVLRQRLKI